MTNTFETFFPLYKRLENKLHEYSVEKDALDNVYYRAKILLTTISELSYRKPAIRKLAIYWLSKKTSTIGLMELLGMTKIYNHNDLIDFNAFARLDSCSLKV